MIGAQILLGNVALTTLHSRGGTSTATQAAVELNRPALTPPAVGVVLQRAPGLACRGGFAL